jgi:hypothetical protein
MELTAYGTFDEQKGNGGYGKQRTGHDEPAGG